MRRLALLAVPVAVAIVLGLGAAPVRGQQTPSTAGPGGTADATFTMALTGDSIITRRLSVYREPEFLEMIELVRSADVAFTNLEILFHDYEPFPMHQSGGTYMRADPELVDELVWAGFDLVSMANNHTGDYGPLGMQLTIDYVDAAGLVYAGAGNSLPEAREARFLETPRARVALISMASTFPDHARAGRSRGDVPPRPGLSPLRHDRTYVVSSRGFAALRDVMRELDSSVPDDAARLRFLGNTFIVGNEPGLRTEPHPGDLAEIAAVVRNASQLADYTIVTIHAHEGDGSRFVPAQFLVTFARAMVDAGADIFLGHGPHVVRGIEIYRGRPIIYSLANFIFQNETLLRLPSENYEPYGLGPENHVADFNARRYDNDRRGFPAQREIWESFVAIAEWNASRLVALRLHPITLGFGEARTVRGRPMLAPPALAEKIIDDVARLSEPFGTSVVFEDGVGRVEVGPTTSQ